MDILALADNYRRWSHGLQYSAQFCAGLDASLTGIFVSEPIVPVPAMNTPLTFPEMYTVTADMAREAWAAEPEFLQWAKGHGVRQARWLVAEGQLGQTLAHAANWHDLLVLESGGESPLGSAGTLGQILLTCGLPCIVVPQTFAKKPSLDTVAIAWKGSAESVRALHGALPLLRRARNILLIHGERTEPFSSVGWKPPFSIDDYLSSHDLHVTREPCSVDGDGAGTELLRIASDASADLLVMGAYGRSRFSEWVLGGATRHVLEHGNLPVFLRH
jgi:nucleotide-binding universal stress UspA family protein